MQDFRSVRRHFNANLTRKSANPRPAIEMATVKRHVLSAKSPAVKLAVVAVMAAAWPFGSQSAQAANDVWIGNTDANFGTLANWTGSVTPNGNTPVFNAAGTAGASLTNDISSATYAGFTFNSGAGAYTIGGNSFSLSGNITNSSSSLQTINNDMTLTNGNKTLAGGAGGLTLGGTITYSQSAAALTFTGTVNSGGNVTISSGGSNSGFITLAGAQTLNLTAGTFTINGTTNGTKSASIIGQNAAGTSNLNLNGGNFTVGTEEAFYLGNNLATAAGVMTITTGTATINRGSTTANDIRSFIALGRDTASGTINLNGGTLATDRNFVRDGDSSADTSGTANFVFGGGTLKALGNQTDWLNSATINTNQLALSSVTTTTTSTIDSNGFSVAINSNISGAGGFNITSSTGTGTVTLGGTNTYNGATTVKTGSLALANSSANNIASSSKILVGDTAAHNTAGLTVSGLNSGGGLALAANQTLAGYGTVTGNVTGVSTSTFAPGDTNANGQLSVKGNFTLGAGSLAVDLNPAVHAAGATLTAGTDYDQLVDATGSTVNVSNGVLALTIGNNLVNNDVFTILDNQGISAVIGNFASATVNGTAATGSLANGGTFSANVGGTNYSFLINYGAGTGNDVTLTVAVPEPGTCAAMIGLGGIGLLTRRRRKA